PLKGQQECARNWRQIGLGTMGLGDMLIKLGIKYGSDESLSLINRVFKTIATTSILTSLELSKEKGCYPMCDLEALLKSSFLQELDLDESILEQIGNYGLANSQLLTCAPTGSIGTMLQVSTGVEPNYAFSYQRRTISLNKEETYYTVDADIVTQYKKRTGNNTLPDYFVSSADINPIRRIEVQAALQKWIDASISSTINLPNSTTIEEVADIYFQAWRYRLKGVTIWRDGCKRQGILTTTKTLERGDIIKAGDSCIGLKKTLVTGCGSLHCEAFFDKNTGDLRECYLSKGSTGGCTNFMIGLSRMISLSARGGVSISNILDQLKSCGTCPSYAVRSATKKDTSKGSSCPVAVGNALKELHEKMLGLLNKEVTKEVDNMEKCPQCSESTLIHTDGCIQCTSCGYSKCN
ncbi:TSCPD domain-containing protein, partial [Intestinibacter sp.]|uniref:TSCPD domain-containing protein n=1 Tax=Intestinibacter sp. TaxID=1965304 RepID=UPI003F154FB8